MFYGIYYYYFFLIITHRNPPFIQLILWRLTLTINIQSGVPNNVGIIDHWHRCKFRVVRVSEHGNQCLQYCLNAFYHDIDNIKKATILWSCVHWSKPGISMLNDNAFVFNRMLGHNTAIYDDVDKNGNLIGSMILPQRAISNLVIIISHIFNQLQMKLTKMLTLMMTLISLSENQFLFISRNIRRHL